MEMHVGFFRAKAVGEYIHLKRTYKDLRYWLITEGFMDSNTTNFPERYFYQSETQKDGIEFYVWWRPAKGLGIFSGGLKGGTNVKFYKSFKINMYGKKLKPAEIMNDGKKVKCHKGTFEVIVHAKLLFSMPKWEKGSDFKKGLFELFWKRIYRKQIETYRKDCLGNMYKLQAHCKKILNMETWKPGKHPFEPKFGFKDDYKI